MEKEVLRQKLHLKRNIKLFPQVFIYLFLKKGEGREKEIEKNINVCLPLMCPQPGTWHATQACARDWESNWWPFGSQAGTQSTEPHHPGQDITLSENAPYWSFNSAIDTDFIDITRMLITMSKVWDNWMFPDFTGEFEQADDQPQKYPSTFCAVYHPQWNKNSW